jgi:NitT/TauT family transport system ATP-binding protein/sulfonate transport system ATP-binding protein
MATGAALRLVIREKRFSGRGAPLFEGLELEVPPSQHLALFGPSGVGKSTLLRLIAGIDTDYDGNVEIDGRAPGAAAVPGFVFQDPRLLPWATAVDNLRIVAPDCDRAEAVRLLGEMGLGGHEDAYPHELSGGMQRRVALARALAVTPRLLILDEPFVSLDRRLARELQGVVARIMAAYRPTTLFVTHDPEDAARLADRILRLEGTPARIVEDLVPPVSPAERTPADIADLVAHLVPEDAGAWAPTGVEAAQ